MSPLLKTAMPGTWVKKLSNTVEFHCNSDGNSSSYSTPEATPRLDWQYIPSFMINDDLGGRSYVDPWDMENYSFLRKQLEDINLSDKELSPAFESTQSDFYYVPLDNNGSPQYQHKHYLDSADYKDDFLPQSYRDDVHGLMANVDEYDFYNENLDMTLSRLHDEDSYLEFSNPSRQSERSRYNNQDYHTYTPPSIIKDSVYVPSQVRKLRRRASAVTFRPEYYTNDVYSDSTFPLKSMQKKNSDIWQNENKFIDNVKIKLNRRKSFHVLPETSGVKFTKLERRKSVLDNPHLGKWETFSTKIIPEHVAKGKLEKRRSIAEISTELKGKPGKAFKEGILQNSENRGGRVGLNVSFENDIESDRNFSRNDDSFQENPSLVYVYETTRRKRKMFLPPASPKIFGGDDFRYNHPKIQDAFSMDPLEQYLNRPRSRYTMTNYGHLKIDYSCSWNYLDKCMAQRICL